MDLPTLHQRKVAELQVELLEESGLSPAKIKLQPKRVFFVVVKLNDKSFGAV